MAYRILDSTLELIAHLYSFMDENEKAGWSMEEARKIVDDQYRYEIEQGMTPPYYSTTEFYEIIADFIRRDAEDEG